MMQEMQHKQPKFQQQIQQFGMYQGGRGRGRGRKGGFQQRNNRRYQSDNQWQSKRKRGPSDDVQKTARFFLPSFLEDPWKALEAATDENREQKGQDPERREQMYPQQVQSYSTDKGLGRVLFQPEFLDDPWSVS
ncbi:unnamed protein product [Peronospora farinosa]|uniref:Uncharacterized protein n=1 Tax=Peronospora farinosa TaxID=134698 RepID=A0AAV0TV48_9STRA|nr:unnamed protein product [Peronospora farinosa]CAI5725584.1 unnamed protein product [Peronospora farinosa]